MGRSLSIVNSVACLALGGGSLGLIAWVLANAWSGSGMFLLLSGLNVFPFALASFLTWRARRHYTAAAAATAVLLLTVLVEFLEVFLLSSLCLSFHHEMLAFRPGQMNCGPPTMFILWGLTIAFPIAKLAILGGGWIFGEVACYCTRPALSQFDAQFDESTFGNDTRYQPAIEC